MDLMRFTRNALIIAFVSFQIYKTWKPAIIVACSYLLNVTSVANTSGGHFSVPMPKKFEMRLMGDGGGGGGGGGDGFDWPDDRYFESGLMLLPWPSHPIDWFQYSMDPLLLAVKQLNEDEDLVVAWNKISASLENLAFQEEEQVNCSCPGACNCKTFQENAEVSNEQSWTITVMGKLPIKEGPYIRLITDKNRLKDEGHMKTLIKENYSVDLSNYRVVTCGETCLTDDVRAEVFVDFIGRLNGGQPEGQGKDNINDSGYLSDVDEASGDEGHPGEKDMEIIKKKRLVRQHQAMSRRVAADDLTKGCCASDCLKMFTPAEIVSFREKFWSGNQKEQRQFILNFFCINMFYSGANGKRTFIFNVNGKKTCRRAWQKIMRISNWRFYQLLKDFEENGRMVSESDKKGTQWLTRKMRKAMAWFEEHAQTCGDKMPDVEQITLPSCQTKKEIYHLYKNDMKRKGIRSISMSAFRRMWTEHFPHVKIYKTNKLTKCGVCTLLKERIMKTRNKDYREVLAVSRKVHLHQQMGERQEYYKRCLKSQLQPTRYLSLILDGMDQSKTNIPHFAQPSKTAPSEFVRIHITGSIAHGSKRVFAFLDLLRWPHDTNLTLNVLLRIFTLLAEEGVVPPILYLQMDNCYRENKNKYVMAFAGFLVQKDIFQEVHLSFLMVGHTHEDVDQFFSRISTVLNREDARTLDDLKNSISASYSPTPEPHEVEFMFDISSWLEPHIMGIKNHVYPHSIRLVKGINGLPEMTYKRWAQDREWRPAEPLKILKSIPEGHPTLIRPSSNKMPSISDLELNIKKCETRFSAEEVQWWNLFIRKEQAYRKRWTEMTEKQMKKLAKDKWFLNNLQRCNPCVLLDEPMGEEEETQHRKIQELLEKENRFPEVKTWEPKKGKKVNPKKNKPTQKQSKNTNKKATTKKPRKA